jgi:hypothetical protein
MRISPKLPNSKDADIFCRTGLNFPQSYTPARCSPPLQRIEPTPQAIEPFELHPRSLMGAIGGGQRRQAMAAECAAGIRFDRAVRQP